VDKVNYNEYFAKERYVVVKGFIDPGLANLLNLYLETKANHLHYKAIFDPHLRNIDYDGHLPGEDHQCPKSFSWYGDCMMDVLCHVCNDKMSEIVGRPLCPTYSFCRYYLNGDTLEKHKDRESCEFSTTLCLGGDPWPLFVRNNNGQDVKIDLEPGDMMVYSGCELLHWREQFQGEVCSQVFLHYNEANGKYQNVFDGRIGMGLPPFMNMESAVDRLKSVSHTRDQLLRILDSNSIEQE